MNPVVPEPRHDHELPCLPPTDQKPIQHRSAVSPKRHPPRPTQGKSRFHPGCCRKKRDRCARPKGLVSPHPRVEQSCPPPPPRPCLYKDQSNGDYPSWGAREKYFRAQTGWGSWLRWARNEPKKEKPCRRPRNHQSKTWRCYRRSGVGRWGEGKRAITEKENLVAGFLWRRLSGPRRGKGKDP